ncbi:MAG: AMP-binding protein, partial [bacterium]|nr:AMP-binding protein [bacterium]
MNRQYTDTLSKKNIETILALTPMQEGILFHYLKEPEQHYYFEQLSLEISGHIDTGLFEEAWNVVVETNEMLRTLFRWENVERPLQVVLKEHKLHAIHYDLSDLPACEGKRKSAEIKENDRKEPFRLQDVPFRVTLCKLEENFFEMIIANHHILYDGWSNGIILEEFFQAYETLANGRQLIKPVKTGFEAFVKQVRNKDLNKQETFWKNYLKGFDLQTELSIKEKTNGERTGDTRTHRLELGGRFKEELGDFIRGRKITLAAFLYCTWGILTQKLNNVGDVVFGTTVSGRSTRIPGIEKMVGLFINTIPFRIRTTGDECVGDLLDGAHGALQKREAFETDSLVNIKEYSPLSKEEDLFDTIIIVENYPLETRLQGKKSGVSLSPDGYAMVERTHYDLTITIQHVDTIVLDFSYNRDVFTAKIIDTLCRRFHMVMAAVMDSPGKKICEIDILLEKEREQLLVEFNNTELDYPMDKSIHGLFEEQRRKTGDKTALLGNSGVSGRRVTVSYGELDTRADRLAWRLRKQGVRPGNIVGIMTKRTVDMLIGMLGILKAGATYLPIDPEYPVKRICYVLEKSGAAVVLTQRDLMDKLRTIGFENRVIDVSEGFCDVQSPRFS